MNTPKSQHAQAKLLTPEALRSNGLNRRQFLWRAGTAAGVLSVSFPAFAGAKPAVVGGPGSKKDIESVRRWSTIANEASGFDHGGPREQLGPGRASRAMAIAHIAIFDVVNSVSGRYESFTGLHHQKGPLSLQAAIAQAAHDTLVALFPSQTARLDTLLAEDLRAVRSKPARANGILLGSKCAATCMAMRDEDGSEIPEPAVGTGPGQYHTSDQPGRWRVDPISEIPLAIGAHWADCKTFALESASQFRVPPPPALDSPAYAAAFNEVKSVGGVNSTVRTADQTHAGIFWAYDGVPNLCAPPKLYNQIAVQIADQMGSDTLETARLLALLNVAMADAGIAIWDSKYFYDFWRPVGGIREADAGTGPSGIGDGNPDTEGDVNFSPLGAPASNVPNGVNFTPPFPAYPSGHAGFGAALFQTLRRVYGTDDIEFTFVSDEFNGITKDNQGNVRPLLPRSFENLSQAEEENGQSRIYLGIHWAFDKTESIILGRKVANYVFENMFRPL